MKKLMSVLLALVLCLSLSNTVWATSFTPSITDKDELPVVPPQLDMDFDMDRGYVIGIIQNQEQITPAYQDALVITTIAQALRDVATGIPEDAKQQLEDVYRQILLGGLKLPINGSSDMVIRELVDISFLQDGFVGGINYLELLQQEVATLTITFDLGVGANVSVAVMIYRNGEWVDVPVINNGDGTVTCVFDGIGIVAFLVPTGTVDPPATGDDMMEQLGLWIVLMVASIAALIVLMVFRRKSEE